MNERTRPMMGGRQAETLGYSVDRTVYPWVAYRGDRTYPDAFFEVCTDSETALLQEFTETRHGERADVLAFQQKFGVPMAPRPSFLDEDAVMFRVRFLVEELHEFVEACRLPFEVKLSPLSAAEASRLDPPDLVDAADALVDLAYVLHGTALMMGLPWAELWDEVQWANMSKVRASKDGSDSKRKSSLDVVKPEGWKGPDHERTLGKGPWPTFVASGPCAGLSFGYCTGSQDPLPGLKDGDQRRFFVADEYSEPAK